MKEKLEFTPEHKQEATQLSKDEFLYSIDVLTERERLGAALDNTRARSILLENEKWIDVFYSPELPVKQRAPEDIRAQLNVRERLIDGGGKSIHYFLRQNGSIDSSSQFFSKKEEEESRRRMEERWGGRWRMKLEQPEKEWAALQKQAEEGLQRVAKRLEAEETEKEIGLAFVSEAELRELNVLLKKIIEREKAGREKK